MTLSIIAFAVLFVLLFLEVPIAFGMAAVGFVGFAVVIGISPALNLVGQIASDTVMNYTLSVVPLFVLMGNFVTQSRISHDLYDASNTFLGHRRGGLAMATIVACGRVQRGLRLKSGDGRNHEPDRDPVDATLWLRRQPGGRSGRGWRNVGDSYPTQCNPRSLRAR